MSPMERTYLAMLSYNYSNFIEEVAGRLADKKLLYVVVLQAIHLQGESADCSPHHSILVIEKLNGLCVERQSCVFSIILQKKPVRYLLLICKASCCVLQFS